jgi:hypothetical protein
MPPKKSGYFGMSSECRVSDPCQATIACAAHCGSSLAGNTANLDRVVQQRSELGAVSVQGNAMESCGGWRKFCLIYKEIRLQVWSS